MDNLTTTQALENLDKVASEYKGTRADHVLLQQSVQLLASSIKFINTTSSNNNTLALPQEVKDAQVNPPFPIEY